VESIASSIERLDSLSFGYLPNANRVADRLRDRSEYLEEKAVENEPREPDYDHEDEPRSREESVIFDVGRLFSEL